jgi:hypothetical protein
VFNVYLVFESSGDIVHVENSGRLDVDVGLKSLFMRVGERRNLCNRLDPEITTKATISNLTMVR